MLFHSPLGVLFTFPSRYLFAIGHGRVLSLGGWSPLLRTGFHVPGPTLDRESRVRTLRVRGSHPLRPAFPCRSARTWFSDCGRGLGAPGSASRNACEATAPALAPSQVWARALSLAATRAISVDFSSSGYLDVSVPPVASLRPMYSGGGARAWPLAGSPIRESPDRRPFAPPRGLSQLAAPFFGFPCQGIRRAPAVSSSRGPGGL